MQDNLDQNVILKVEDLCLSFGQKKILKNVSFQVRKGETVGIVGETGSGKSMTAMAVMGLLPDNATVSGRITFDGRILTKLTEKEQAAIRGDDLSMVFQDPMTFLDPVMKVGKQVGEPLRNHGIKDKKERKKRVLELFRKVSFKDPELIYKSYPHELSGGMRQRALIAQALIGDPKLLIADEPTTALDPKVADDILSLIEKLNMEHKDMAMLFISHDLDIIRRMCDRVLVMYQGELVEEGKTRDVFERPKEEYTKTLVADIPHCEELAGDDDTVLKLTDVSAFYKDDSGVRHDILENVSFHLKENETLGLVGESGSGKSTLARIITGLNKEYTGKYETFGNKPQMIFQDAYSSLNPAKTVEWIMEIPLKVRGIKGRKERRQMIIDILEKVGLDESYLDKKPKNLSGGQRQRVCIGCALCSESKLIIADEAVSSLDVTVSSKILKLMQDLQKEKGFGILFISHNMELVSKYCHRVLKIEDKTVKEGDKYEVINKEA